ATSASESSGFVWRCARRCAANRALPASRLLALFALRVKSCAGRRAGLPLGRAGGSWSTTVALVPPTPSELTAARRGCTSGAGHALRGQGQGRRRPARRAPLGARGRLLEHHVRVGPADAERVDRRAPRVPFGSGPLDEPVGPPKGARLEIDGGVRLLEVEARR